MIVLPAGVSHVMTGNSDDNLMVGSYPDGRDWDNVQEEHITEEIRRAAVKRIMMLPIPARDPVTGAPMREWIEAPSSVDADLNDLRDNLDPSIPTGTSADGRASAELCELGSDTRVEAELRFPGDVPATLLADIQDGPFRGLLRIEAENGWVELDNPCLPHTGHAFREAIGGCCDPLLSSA